MDSLLLYLLDAPGTQPLRVRWLLCDDASPAKNTVFMPAEMRSGQGDLDTFTALYRQHTPGKPVTAVIPGHCLTWMQVPVSIKNTRQLLQALPFLVEEQVIGNIEDMRIVTPPRISGESIRIAILDKVLLEQYKALFAAQEIAVTALYGLPDMLSCASDGMHLALLGDTVALKSARQCVECEADNLDVMLESLDFTGVSAVQVSAAAGGGADEARVDRVRVRLASEAVTVTLTPLPADSLAVLMPSAEKLAIPALNLLQEDLAAPGLGLQQLNRYLPLAWAALLCVFLQIGFNLTSGYYFKRYATKVEKGLAVRYLALFPDETRVVDLGAQLKGKLNSARLTAPGRGFDEIFATTIQVMNKTGSMKDIHVRQFRYDAESGELKMGLETGSVAQLDKIKQGLAEKSYVVDIISANEEGDTIKATLSIKQG